MKTLILAAIRCSLIFTAVTASLFCAPHAHAFTVTIDQVGSNVVVTGSGAFNLAGLTFVGSLTGGGSDIQANTALIALGTTGQVDLYTGFTGPTSFGIGSFHFANATSGDVVLFERFVGNLFLPRGYVSGNHLSDSLTFNNLTLASLGVTPGTYRWTRGDWIAAPELHTHHRRGWRA